MTGSRKAVTRERRLLAGSGCSNDSATQSERFTRYSGDPAFN